MTQMTELLKSFPDIEDGVHESRLKEVLFFQETKHVPRRPIVYDPGIAIVAQGHKIGFLGGQKFQYDTNNNLQFLKMKNLDCNDRGFFEGYLAYNL